MINLTPDTFSQAQWTTEVQQPIVTFLSHMTGFVREGRLAAPLAQICDCHSKVSDAIIYSNGIEKSNHSNAGLAAVFLGIQQGKIYVKNANKHVLEVQSVGGSNLEDLQKHLSSLDDFAQKMSSCTSKDFAWEQAISLGIHAFNSLNLMIQSTPKSTPQSTKTTLGDGKRILSEYVATICRAFLVGPFQSWLCEAKVGMEIRNVPPLPSVEFSDWKGIASSRHLSADACSLGQLTMCARKFIGIIHKGLTISFASTKEASTDVELAHLLNDISSFKEKQWASLNEAGLISEKGAMSVDKVNEQIKAAMASRMASHLDDACTTVGDLMSKVWLDQT